MRLCRRTSVLCVAIEQVYFALPLNRWSSCWTVFYTVLHIDQNTLEAVWEQGTNQQLFFMKIMQKGAITYYLCAQFHHFFCGVLMFAYCACFWQSILWLHQRLCETFCSKKRKQKKKHIRWNIEQQYLIIWLWGTPQSSTPSTIEMCLLLTVFDCVVSRTVILFFTCDGVT